MEESYNNNNNINNSNEYNQNNENNEIKMKIIIMKNLYMEVN